jgi:uncharacterized protein YfdQ (DUF2303 family)
MNDQDTKAGAAPVEGLAIQAASVAEFLQIDQSAIQKIGALTTAATAIQQASGTTHLVLPEGYKHIDLTSAILAAQPTPTRKAGSVVLSDIGSFKTYVEDQGNVSGGYIYADPEGRTLTAVLNDQVQSVATAGWRDFRAVYQVELSREFDKWIRNNKQPMEQEQFAIFLEDNIADVCDPSGETLLSIALTLQAKNEVNFSTSRRLDNGQVQFTYTENIDARAGTGSIEIPREFTIGLRLFKNGEGYKIRARLKYRLGAGKVKFWYELDRPENSIEDAFKAYIKQAGDTGLTVLIGKP